MSTTPLVVGILNISPDSFSELRETECRDSVETTSAVTAIIQNCQQLLSQRPDVIEIGGESTRPGATPCTQKQELERIAPIFPLISRLARASNIALAIDTRFGETAEYALQHGATIINDVSGCSDPEMVRLLKSNLSNDVYYVAMHSLTVPADRNIIITGNPISEILGWIQMISGRIRSYGFPSNRLMIDPGIGFGKNAEQSLAIIGSLARIRAEGGYPIYIGHSRKSCLAFTPDQHPADRDLETHVLTGFISQCNVSYIRVHDVSGTRRAIEVCRKLKNSTMPFTPVKSEMLESVIAPRTGDFSSTTPVNNLVKIDGTKGA